MRTDLNRKMEILANASTIDVAVLMSVGLVKSFILRPVSPGTARIPEAVVGGSLKRALPLDYTKNRATLILAISTHCHFCAESVPFFQRIRERAGDKIVTAVVLPETVEEGQRYVAERQIRATEVRQVSLAGLGAGGTPTILPVDDSGIIRNIWVGKLDAGGQDKVLSILADWHS